MKDITQIEARLDAALDRIAVRLAAPPGHDTPEAAQDSSDDSAPATATPAEAAPTPEDVARLEEALEAERATNAQLEERVRTIRARDEQQIASLESESERMRARAAASEDEAARLRALTERLIESNRTLRGSCSPDTVTAAENTEHASLAALRDSDRAEIDALIGEIAPLVGDAQDA